MHIRSDHTFHIPVLGIGFSVDAPLKVARYGISSVMSLVDDGLMEELRKHYLQKDGLPYEEIAEREEDSRAKRITAYLNMVHLRVKEQFHALRESTFHRGSDLHTYFQLLPDFSALKRKYHEMLETSDDTVVQRIQRWLREHMVPGAIEVNIMTKLDKANYVKGMQLPVEFNDAHAALRGFANSDLESPVVFSAGMNPRLYSYLATFEDFFPNEEGRLRKRIIIKVSDFRSALIQGKFLAKKGLWVSEYRIESGLNCGGHAFATDGLLMGPILEEFKLRREELLAEQQALYTKALQDKGLTVQQAELHIAVTAQGGVGTATEQRFMAEHYGLDSIGWGTPFLLVPEVMNVPDDTLEQLRAAKEDDLYLSAVSPLGVPFNNLRGNSKDVEKEALTAAGKPGSPCVKKFLQLNTELSDRPLCTASITFLKKKIKNLREEHAAGNGYQKHFDAAVDKACLCEGLTAPALNVNDIALPKLSKAVSVCPGPNLAYFSRVSTLREMVDHIYGRLNLMTEPERPHVFLKELQLYVDYFYRQVKESMNDLSSKTEAYLETFRENLLEGITYYKSLIPEIREETEQMRQRMHEELIALENRLLAFAAVPA